MTKMNDQIRAVADSFKDPKVHYVSITERFNGHRFCEAGSSSRENRYGSDNIWFWNVSPRDVFWHRDVVFDSTLDNTIRGLTAPVGTVAGSPDQAKQEEADRAWVGAYNTDPPSNSSLHYFDWRDLLNFDIDVSALSSPTQGGTAAWQLRPFHPTEPGHQAIKEAIKAAM